jgi:acetolactate synthase-1/3 small subunit
MKDTKLHTFIATMEDKAGVLNRVVSLFRRRAYNIVSLNVGRTHQPGVSRMTVVIEADAATAKQLETQLAKLINVIEVHDVTERAAVLRDMALIKVNADVTKRAEVLQVCNVFRAHVVDVGPHSVTLEITGTQDKIEGLAEVLEPFGIAEMVQCGAMAMIRGAVSTHPRRVEAA